MKVLEVQIEGRRLEPPFQTTLLEGVHQSDYCTSNGSNRKECTGGFSGVDRAIVTDIWLDRHEHADVVGVTRSGRVGRTSNCQ